MSERALFDLFTSPRTGAPLRREGERLVGNSGESFPIVRGIPRFVPHDAYLASFSLQWNAFRTTQLDSVVGNDDAEQSLRVKTGLTPEQVRGRLVLDAGLGAGRYAEVLSRWGARVIGVDLSFSVEAAQQNLAGREQVVVAQADIFDLPFAPATFDLVISIGVLHHTPDTRAAFERLVPLVRPGGEVCVWVYSRDHHYLLRQHWTPFVSRIPPEWFHTWCRWWVPFSRARPRNPLLRYLNQLFECSELGGGVELDVLGTFDGYSPRYHWVHSPSEVQGWFRAAGLEDVRALPWDTAVRGRRPAARA